MERTALPQDAYTTLDFPLPSNVVAALDADHDDVSVKIVLNVNAGSGPYHLDNLRFL